MKPIWWLLLIALGALLYMLGHLNWQVSKFVRFLAIFFPGVFATVFIFWFFLRGKVKE